MTLQEFTTLYNEERKRTMGIGYYPKTFNLIKSKVMKKAVITYEADDQGRPTEVSKTPAVSKKVPDTNKYNDVCQALWEYYLKTDLKRISSEGKWRSDGKGGGNFIKSSNKGFADLHGLFDGNAYYIETKRRSEYHLDSQLKFAEWVRNGGGVYVSVTTFEDMYQLVQAILNNTPLDQWFALKKAKRRKDDKPLFG
jgi:hypothetical protein